MKKFEVLFLTEAREFLLLIDAKSRDKVIFNIDKAKIKTDDELFKNYKVKFGNSEHYLTRHIIEYLLFGTKKISKKLLSLRLTEL